MQDCGRAQKRRDEQQQRAERREPLRTSAALSGPITSDCDQTQSQDTLKHKITTNLCYCAKHKPKHRQHSIHKHHRHHNHSKHKPETQASQVQTHITGLTGGRGLSNAYGEYSCRREAFPHAGKYFLPKGFFFLKGIISPLKGSISSYLRGVFLPERHYFVCTI